MRCLSCSIDHYELMLTILCKIQTFNIILASVRFKLDWPALRQCQVSLHFLWDHLVILLSLFSFFFYQLAACLSFIKAVPQFLKSKFLYLVIIYRLACFLLLMFECYL